MPEWPKERWERYVNMGPDSRWVKCERPAENPMMDSATSSGWRYCSYAGESFRFRVTYPEDILREAAEKLHATDNA